MSAGDPLARLRALRAERSDQLLEALLQEPPAPDRLATLGEALRLTDAQLLERRPRARHPARRTVVAAALVALVLSAASAWHVPTTPFTLDVEATSADLDMAAAGDLSVARVDTPIRVEGLTAIATSPGLHAVVPASAPGALVMAGETTLLRRASWPAGARLRLEAQADRTRLTLLGARSPATVVLEASGRGRLRVDGEDGPGTVDFGPGGWIESSASPPAGATHGLAPPLSVAFDTVPARRLAWDALRPAALAFVELRPRADGLSEASSSLVKATLSLPDVDRSAAFGRGDGLALEGLSITHGEATLGTTVHLILAGTARDVRMLSGEKWRSLQPSWLEFLARNHAVALLWSAAAFLWAARHALEKAWPGDARR